MVAHHFVLKRNSFASSRNMDTYVVALKYAERLKKTYTIMIQHELIMIQVTYSVFQIKKNNIENVIVLKS